MKHELKWYKALAFCRGIGSLNRCVTKAGGCFFSVKKIKTMSAFELIQILGQNNIYFYYDKERNENGKTKLG